MGSLNDLRDQLSALIVEGQNLDLGSLFFSAEGTARLATLTLLGLALCVLLIRTLTRRSVAMSRASTPTTRPPSRMKRMTSV